MAELSALRSPLARAVAGLGFFMLSLLLAAASAQQVEWLRRFGAAGITAAREEFPWIR